MRHALLLLIAGCVTPVPTPDPKPPIADAGCAEACTVQRELGCPGGLPTEEGEPCERVCEDAESFLPGSYHAECVAAQVSCDAVDGCFE